MAITITPSQSTAREYGALGTMTITVENGAVYTSNQQLALSASGGTAPYSWEIISGRIPPGLQFAAGGSGAFSGQPSARGTALIQVRVTDSATPIPNFADADITIEVA